MSVSKVLSYYCKSLTLLIVEDEKDVVESLVDSLGLFFKSVDFAYDGEEGLRKYRKNRVDIVLTDITMPKMDGITMSKKIKALKPDQSIIVISAHSDTKYMIELIDMNINKFILKPFDRNTLVFKLLKVAENIIFKKRLKAFSKARHQNTLERIKIINAKDKIGIEKSKNLTAAEDVVSSDENYHYSHKKEDAQNFMSKIESDDLVWQAFKDDIPDLLQLSEEFTQSVDEIDLEGFTVKIRDEIVRILRGYVLIFSTLDQMKRMTEVLTELTSFLEFLEPEKFTESQQKKIKLLSYINDDITRFLETIFVYQDSVDIYYLEDSLASSLVQLKSNVLGTEIEDEDEEELELF